MNLRRLVPALVVALVLSGLFTFWLSRRFSKTAAAPAATHRFVAVNRNMEPGEQLAASALQTVEWPASQPLKGTFLKPDEVVGRVLSFPLVAGEVVLERHLAPVGTTTGLTAKIPPGMRAIALRSDEVAGVAGFLLPGTLVDVLLTYHPGGDRIEGSTDLVTVTVLQKVHVLAAGQKMEADPDGKANMASVVTLLVTPQEAETLTLASARGKILFVLRNGSDQKDVADLGPQSTLPGVPAPVPPKVVEPVAPPRVKVVVVAPPPVPQYTVQVISGDKQTQATFDARSK